MRKYEKFSLMNDAKLGENYISSMVDDNNDYLPYWFIQINANPAYARHVRVDDAELVASWYEAAVCLERITGGSRRLTDVKEGFKRHLLKSWADDGLRYHEPYPWSNTLHCSFHEMGWVLAGLNRLLEEEPYNKEARDKARGLVTALYGLVFKRKIRTFWSGDFPFSEKIYEFPSDLYLKDIGFAPEHVTGRGEECIRNAVLLQPLVKFYELDNFHAAIDLAEGIANHMLGISRYFNYKSEFFGHVHSTMWFACGLVRLGRVMGAEKYIERGKEIFEYVCSISTEFGWVPEYAQWSAQHASHCETCCIKDMIECAFELIDCGYDYWDLINKYVRNQLSEQQFKTGSFIAVDNSLPDQDGKTWRDIDKRAVGGWSGGAEINSISLEKFRNIAGCCAGTAPQALWLVWSRIIQQKGNKIYINLPIDRSSELADICCGYPNDGYIKISAKAEGDYLIRPYDWMGNRIEIIKNAKNLPLCYSDGCILVQGVRNGDTIEVRHPLHVIKKEINAQGSEFTVYWKGADVVKISPEGNHIRLYQREEGVPKVYPDKARSGEYNAATVDMAPTEQKR